MEQPSAAGESMQAGESMEVGGGRRLTLAPRALLVEARSVGRTWVPARVVEYDEIAAAYSYSCRDWSVLGIAAAAWIGLLLLIAVVWAVLQGTPLVLGVALLGATVLVAGVAAFRFLTAPRRLLRVDALGGSIVLPETSPRFFHGLSARLPKPGPQPPVAPAPAGEPVPPTDLGVPAAESPPAPLTAAEPGGAPPGYSSSPAPENSEAP